MGGGFWSLQNWFSVDAGGVGAGDGEGEVGAGDGEGEGDGEGVVVDPVPMEKADAEQRLFALSICSQICVFL